MKKTSLILFSSALLGLGGVSINGTNTEAATYSDALNGQGKGTIVFTDGATEEIPDPENPDKPVVPVDPENPDVPPINPATGDLLLTYVPDFNFGTHKKTTTAFEAKAQKIDVKDITNGTPSTTTRKTVPFVTTKDMRVDRKTGWTLSVTSSQFKAASSAHVIDGAQVSLSNVNYADGTTGTAAEKPAINGSASDPGKALALTPGTAVKVANASSTTTPGQGVGLYSLALGSNAVTTAEDTTNGVTFSMPAKTAVNTDTYSATFDWNLSPDLQAFS